uniref:Uncharacterized protein n=1 Tax=Arundo donax TaxID=35708 RepID=A0A0A9H4P9_ARUDO
MTPDPVNRAISSLVGYLKTFQAPIQPYQT